MYEGQVISYIVFICLEASFTEIRLERDVEKESDTQLLVASCTALSLCEILK